MIANKDFKKLMEDEGAVVIPFLFQEELAEVIEFYKAMREEYTFQFTNGMHMTLWHSDLAFKQKVKEHLVPLLQPAFERNFSNYRRLNNVFIVKQANTTGAFAVHNDWSIVDESLYTSINVWIPLQNTTPDNGALWVIKGSHKIDMPVRGGGALLPDFTSLEKTFEPYIVPLNVVAGEAILFYHKTIHGSYPNTSNEDRVVCTSSLIPQEATLQICFQKDKGSPLEIYEPEDDFNYKYNNLLEDSNSFIPGRLVKRLNKSFQQRTLTEADILPYIIAP